jgi:L-lactate dehydrogenase
MPTLLDVALDAVIVMVTSAVDVLTLAALKLSGLPAHRVLGRGTVLGPRGSVT